MFEQLGLKGARLSSIRPHPPHTSMVAGLTRPTPMVAGLKPNAVKSMEGRVTSADWVNPSAPTQAVAAS